ncbi:putative NAD(P)/FAD-binding protein YdhS [Streptomyces sp. V4I23]|uniref:FAD/NAD(P)-binding protein n=1 Tax=Streptomyces sp. V4I23 TaxID=3042282 RepID=UPI00278918DC|nr:putative NAD(P)/FAD-binding protein YdhS [Streptomyces sp. V4I23]
MPRESVLSAGSAQSPRPFAIALVGAGPRGTCFLERLCASVPDLAPDTPLTVHVVDPAAPGAGRVWRTDQNAELLMNTVASQVTVFTDDSVACEGPIRPGPSLYEWAAGRPGERLGPDDYPTRACYGRYLEWAFARTVGSAPEAVRVRVHRALAVRLEDDRDAPADVRDPLQSLRLDDGTLLSGLSAVVLAQGHLPVVSRQSTAQLADYAARRPRLRHFPPANPADLDLSGIAAGERVLLRGLGLSFFDHLALLTTGRGGSFVRDGERGLVYRPSGREPKLYAGSRRGVPHQARGDNAKGPSGRHEPLVLTPEVIAGFRERAEAGHPADFLSEIWPLVAKEVETVYYASLPAVRERETAGGGAGAGSFRERFLAAGHGSAEEAETLEAFGVAEADRWSWDRLARPHRGEVFTSRAGHRAWLLAYLRADAAHAGLGNVEGPVKAALDVLRDVRNELRLIVDHGGLTGTSRRDHLDRWYTPLNAFLSIGPPRRRIEEMTALIEAGVLEVVGPRMSVGTEAGLFTAQSPDVPGSAVTFTTLIEARLPEPDLRRTCDELLGRLLKTGQCRPHAIDGYETGGLDVTPRPYRLVNRQGRAHPRRFAFGVPTEGVHWVTAAGARPGVDSVTLSDADAVARAALRSLAPPLAGAGRGPRRDIEAGIQSGAEIGRRQNVELASMN